MSNDIIRRLMWIPVVVLLVLSLIFGCADANKSKWKGNDAYFDEFVMEVNK